MSPKARQSPTIMEVALRHAGFRKGYRACMYLAQWGVAADALGSQPNSREVADWWAESRATAYRNEACFREAFPGQSPADLWALVSVSAGEALEVVVPAVAATGWAA